MCFPKIGSSCSERFLLGKASSNPCHSDSCTSYLHLNCNLFELVCFIFSVVRFTLMESRGKQALYLCNLFLNLLSSFGSLCSRNRAKCNP